MRLTRTRIRARARLPVLPIHGNVALQAAQLLMGDDAEVVVAHDFNRALVLRQGVIERDSSWLSPSSSPRWCAARMSLASLISS